MVCRGFLVGDIIYVVNWDVRYGLHHTDAYDVISSLAFPLVVYFKQLPGSGRWLQYVILDMICLTYLCVM